MFQTWFPMLLSKQIAIKFYFSSYLFDTIDGGQMLMGLSSMMGFIPYIIVYLLQSLQVPSKIQGRRFYKLFDSLSQSKYKIS